MQPALRQPERASTCRASGSEAAVEASAGRGAWLGGERGGAPAWWARPGSQSEGPWWEWAEPSATVPLGISPPPAAGESGPGALLRQEFNR